MFCHFSKLVCLDVTGDLSLSICLAEYLARTRERRDYFEKAEGKMSSHMFITHTKPFQTVKPATLAKWLDGIEQAEQREKASHVSRLA